MKIALVGKSGTGKSEVSRHLAERYGLKHIKTGSVCRQISHLLFGNDDKANTQRLDDQLTKIDPSIFLRAVLRDVDTTEPIVIDALRFKSDYALARQMGYSIIRVVANADVRIQRLQMRGQVFIPETDGMHRSEVELDDVPVDFEVVNDGSISDLHAALESALSGL